MEIISIYIGYFLTGILGLGLCFLVLYSLDPRSKEIVQNNANNEEQVLVEQRPRVIEEEKQEEERFNENVINQNNNIDLNDFDLGEDEDEMLQLNDDNNMNDMNNNIDTNNNNNNIMNMAQNSIAMKKMAKKMEKKRVREQRAAYIQYLEQIKVQREEKQEIARTLREMAYVDKDLEDEDRLKSHKAMEESWRALIRINQVEHEQQKVEEIDMNHNVKQFINSNNNDKGLSIHTIAKKFGLSILSVYHLAVKMHDKGEIVFFPASELIMPMPMPISLSCHSHAK